MDCSAFRRHHLAYVDDTLPGDLLVAAARHAAECPVCARHDTAVRRSLLLARNVCELECSPDFAARLEARLHTALAEDRAGRVVGRPGLRRANDDWTPSWWELASSQVTGHLAVHRRTRQAVAAAAVLAAVSAGAALRGERPSQVQGLGGGMLAAPFGSPFAAASTPALGSPQFGTGAAPTPGATPVAFTSDGGFEAVPNVPNAGPNAVALVPYDGAVDAGALVAPAAMGVPVWAAAMLAGEVPAALWGASGSSSVQLVRDAH